MVIKDLFEIWDKKELFIILQEITGLNREKIILNPNYELKENELNKIYEIIEERKKHKPLQYILGKWWFYDFEVYINEGVLIPRPETEILVEEALKYLKPDMKVLDIGTGSGIIAIAIAKHIKDIEIIGVDKSEKAIELAKKNAEKNNLDKIDFRLGDLFDPVKGHKFNMIVTNPPYIESGEKNNLEKEILYEPDDALFSGEDGLDCIKKIIKKVVYFIDEKGIILMEVGHNQGKAVKKLLEDRGFKEIQIIKDYNNFDRIVKGIWGG